MNEIEKIATQKPEKRKSLLSDKERSLVFGLLYALVLSGLTLLLDLIPVPKEDSMLWLMFAMFYLVIIVLTILMEHFLLKKRSIRRGLFYATAQILMLIAVIVLSVVGAKTSGEEYYNSRELSYAMAFCFNEVVLLFYHLVRAIVLAIVRSCRENKTGKSKKKAKKK